ncbi:hypothetical protein [Bradyrhizobium sp.]|uniref:hypothetical protein n=1 Tax=Bradyrhizobium sp. TaxID=376 RepID=UPI003C536CC2
MKRRLVVLGLFAAVVIGAAVLVRLNFYHVHVRYRLSVDVQDGDQLRTGSSVIELRYTMQPDSTVNLGGPDIHPRPLGYAPTVDLGDKGLLFLTFMDARRTPDQERAFVRQLFCPLDEIGCLPFAAYDKPGTMIGRNYSQQKAALEDVRRQSGPRDVAFTVLPQLVRFRDINDPHTLVRVSPDDLAANFGPGVELKRVILELTDAPITPQPPIWPQWLKQRENRYAGILFRMPTP